MAKRRGFTLIEVMVVMAIIAILATAGISSYSWYIKKTNDLKTTILLENLNAAAIEFKGHHNGRLPTKSELRDYIALRPTLSQNPLASLPNILGIPKAFAQATTFLVHPAGNRLICIRSDNGITYFYDILCEIVYYRFSDGKFAFSGGVTTKTNLKNFHKGENVDGSRETYGIFVGNSPIIGRPEVFLSNALGAYNIGKTTPVSLITAESLTFDTSTNITSTTETNTDSSSSTDDNNTSSSTTETDTGSSSSTDDNNTSSSTTETETGMSSSTT